MSLVYIPGVWDLLHVGHLIILERARSLGDKLVVGVASDEVVQLDKGRLPIIQLGHRLRMLNALTCVNLVIPYYDLEFLSHLRMLKPSIMVVGETWGNDIRHEEAEKWVEENNAKMIKLPYTKDISTTSIKHKILQQSKSY